MANNGILGLPPGVQRWTDTARALEGVDFAPNMDAVRQREADLAAYLGQTDYDKQLQESRSMAKLQLGLALAQRGFGSMGAQPRPGEMAISTVGRELISPLAGDVMTVSQQLHQHKLATQQAKRQEDRQLKLAALTGITSEDAARRSLATELTPKAGADTLNDTVHYVLRQGTDEEWEFVPQTDDGQGRLQVRLQKGTGAPYDVQTQTLRSLLRGEIIVKAADVRNYIPDLVPSDDAVKISATGRVQKWVPGDDGKLRLEPELYETKAVWQDGELTQVRVDTNEVIAIGTGSGEYQVYEKPTAADKPAGTADPEFQDSLAGLLAKLPHLRRTLNKGRRGLVFDAAKYGKNPNLVPGEDFPFSRIDNVPMTEEEQQIYADKLRNAYYNVFPSIKTGEDRADLNRTFVEGFLDSTIADLGLPDVQGPSLQRPRAQITTGPEITQAYVRAAKELKDNPNALEVIARLPDPVTPINMRSGTARLVLYNQLGVRFGEATQAPPGLSDNPAPQEIHDRASSVRDLDASSIQERMLAESLAKSATPLGASLRPDTANTIGKQLVVVGDALDKKRKTLDDALADSDGKQIGETVGKTLDTIAMLDRLDAQMIISGLPGFVRGPLEVFAKGRLGIDVGAWLRTEEGQRAANELMANLPLLQNFVGRELLKGTGEQRISNTDLEGAKATLININKSGSFNEDQLRALRGYLVNSVTHSLEYVGAYSLPERTLEKAAQLGIDVKSIKGQNGFYSPYLRDQTYAVTGHPVPSYSRDYQTLLRDNSIFGYVARESVTGVPQYELMQVDEKGRPIWDDNTKRFQTITVPGRSGWQAKVDPETLAFNRNFLIKTYRLDR
jgi:hypothetical protein